MNSSLYSDSWYRVESLHPRLRAHIEVQRRRYRGATWYVLRDTSTGKHHRVSEVAYHIVGRLTGRQSVQEVWAAARASLADRAPTQDEVISLLGTLHESHLIQSELTPDVDELFRRHDTNVRRQRAASVNPLSFRVPLLDPTRFLDRWVARVRPLYTRAGLLVWLSLMLLAALQLLPHWRELLAHGGRLLETRQLILLVLTYPVIKALHEFGHAFAVRVWGGDVREMGVALMLFIPVPYVDASASSGFRERHRRIVVSAAGIMVELFLAALAGLLWLRIEDGLLRDMAFTVMAIGGVSTALFNGNPLMRLDGYYLLSDALEIPNLGARASQSCVRLIQRLVLRAEVRQPAADGFERWFLPVYGIASLAYRLFISAVMVLWVAAKSVVLAVALGSWMVVIMLVLPLRRAVNYMLTTPDLRRRRGTAVLYASLCCAGIAGLLFALPLPSASVAQGVVWYPEHAQVRTQVSGFVEQVHAEDGSLVEQGAPLADMMNPVLRAQLERGESRQLQLQSKLRNAMRERTAELQSAAEELAAAEKALEDLRGKVAGLSLTAHASGRLVLPRGQDLPGSYIKQGATLGHVVTGDDMIVRVAVTQEQAARIRERVERVSLRTAESIDEEHPGRVVNEVPAAEQALHSAALGDRGGGEIRTDPADKDGLKTLSPVYLFDIAVPGVKPTRVGGRAFVRFDHGAEPVGRQWMRALRQLFLKNMEA